MLHPFGVLERAVVAGDPVAAAAAVDLHYTTDADPGIRRTRRGYFRDGVRVRDRATLARIRALAIPPAWTDVWISRDPDGHVQATGRDARGRKQYRYHRRWRTVRDDAKYHRLVDFCRALPALRRRVAADLARPALDKDKVVATVVALMESAQLRVGNDEYARSNHSYGATTLRNRHARFHGDTLELSFRGKGGIARRARVTDRQLARIVHRCQALPGQRLFQYVDGDGVHAITSTDVNDYLREATGGPFTAKDYRTWAATLAAAIHLSTRHDSVRDVIAAVAEQLGHTPAVCRSSYIHPRLLEDGAVAAIEKQVRRRVPRNRRGHVDASALRSVERIVSRFLVAPAVQRRRA
jgi:DNA topoisomerase-1